MGNNGKDINRCAICGWPLGLEPRECKRGDCAMRPFPTRYYDLERAKKEYAPHILPKEYLSTEEEKLRDEVADLRDKLAEADGLIERSGKAGYIKELETTLASLVPDGADYKDVVEHPENYTAKAIGAKLADAEEQLRLTNVDFCTTATELAASEAQKARLRESLDEYVNGYTETRQDRETKAREALADTEPRDEDDFGPVNFNGIEPDQLPTPKDPRPTRSVILDETSLEYIKKGRISWLDAMTTILEKHGMIQPEKEEIKP